MASQQLQYLYNSNTGDGVVTQIEDLENRVTILENDQTNLDWNADGTAHATGNWTHMDGYNIGTLGTASGINANFTNGNFTNIDSFNFSGKTISNSSGDITIGDSSNAGVIVQGDFLDVDIGGFNVNGSLTFEHGYNSINRTGSVKIKPHSQADTAVFCKDLISFYQTLYMDDQDLQSVGTLTAQTTETNHLSSITGNLQVDSSITMADNDIHNVGTADGFLLTFDRLSATQLQGDIDANSKNITNAGSITTGFLSATELGSALSFAGYDISNADIINFLNGSSVYEILNGSDYDLTLKGQSNVYLKSGTGKKVRFFVDTTNIMDIDSTGLRLNGKLIDGVSALNMSGNIDLKNHTLTFDTLSITESSGALQIPSCDLTASLNANNHDINSVANCNINALTIGTSIDLAGATLGNCPVVKSNGSSVILKNSSNQTLGTFTNTGLDMNNHTVSNCSSVSCTDLNSSGDSLLNDVNAGSIQCTELGTDAITALYFASTAALGNKCYADLNLNGYNVSGVGTLTSNNVITLNSSGSGQITLDASSGATYTNTAGTDTVHIDLVNNKINTGSSMILDSGFNKIRGLSAATGNGEALRYEQLVGVYLPLAGGTMSGNIAMGTNKLSGLAAGTTNGDSVRYDEFSTVTTTANNAIQKGGSVTFTANQPMGSHKLTGLSAGTATGDSARYDELITYLPLSGGTLSGNVSCGGHDLSNAVLRDITYVIAPSGGDINVRSESTGSINIEVGSGTATMNIRRYSGGNSIVVSPGAALPSYGFSCYEHVQMCTLNPVTDNTYDIGSSSLTWKNLYCKTLNATTVNPTNLGTCDFSGKTLQSGSAGLTFGSTYGSVFYGDGHTMNVNTNGDASITMAHGYNAANSTGGFVVKPYGQSNSLVVNKTNATFSIPLIATTGTITTLNATTAGGTWNMNENQLNGLKRISCNNTTNTINVYDSTGGLSQEVFRLAGTSNTFSSQGSAGTLDGWGTIKAYSTNLVVKNSSATTILTLNATTSTYTSDVSLTNKSLIDVGAISGSTLNNIVSSNTTFGVTNDTGDLELVCNSAKKLKVHSFGNSNDIFECSTSSIKTFVDLNMNSKNITSGGTITATTVNPTNLGTCDISSKTLQSATGRITLGSTYGTECHGDAFYVTIDTNSGGTINMNHGYSASNTTGCFQIAPNGQGVNFVHNKTNTLIYNFPISTTIVPHADNTYALGSSGTRWSVVYAATGTINTSDERMKTDIVDSDLGLAFVEKLRPVKYKWKSQNEPVIDEEGCHVKEYQQENGEWTSNITDKPRVKTTTRCGNRPHYGLLSQELKQVLDEVGTDSGAYIYDYSCDSYGIRYDELIAPMIKAIQQLSDMNTKLMARVSELEFKLS